MLPKATSGTSISGFVSANHSVDALWTGSWVAHRASVLLPFSPHMRDRKTDAPWATQLPVHNASALWLAEPQQSGRPVDSRLGEGTSRCQTVCPWAVRWADALGAVPGRPWDGIWHTGDVIGHTRDVLGRPVDGRIVPRTSTGQWTHYGRSRPTVAVQWTTRGRPLGVRGPVGVREFDGFLYLLYSLFHVPNGFAYETSARCRASRSVKQSTICSQSALSSTHPGTAVGGARAWRWK